MNPYAQLTDLYNFGARASAYGDLTTGQQQAHLDAAAATADAAFRARYGYQNVPLVPPIDPAITQKVCELASWNLITLRGFDGTNESDKNIRDRGMMAVRWFAQVERQEQHPNVQVSVQSDATVAAPMVISNPLQGWIPDPSGASSTPGPSGVN